MVIWTDIYDCSDVLHPQRPNVSKEDLRSKLAELYKADKNQVSVFGFRTQYGGGKSTGFALIYENEAAMKKFEPHYRLVRVGMATKKEKASRQQRKFGFNYHAWWIAELMVVIYRQTTQEQVEGVPWCGEGQGRCIEEGQEIGIAGRRSDERSTRRTGHDVAVVYLYDLIISRIAKGTG